MIVDAYTLYNMLLIRPSINAFGTIVLTRHLVVKFLSDIGIIITMHVD